MIPSGVVIKRINLGASGLVEKCSAKDGGNDRATRQATNWRQLWKLRVGDYLGSRNLSRDGEVRGR